MTTAAQPAITSVGTLTGLTMSGTINTPLLVGTGSGNDYNTGGVMLQGNGSTNTVFPTLGFHQLGLYASSIQLRGASDIRFYAQGAAAYANITTGNITANGTIVASGDITAFSDAKLKTNVKTIDNAVDLVKQMRGVTYNVIASGKASVGVIAQEIKEVLPQVVAYDAESDTHSVAYGNIVGVLIEAVKAQQAQIDELSARLARLDTKF